MMFMLSADGSSMADGPPGKQAPVTRVFAGRAARKPHSRATSPQSAFSSARAGWRAAYTVE